MIYLGSQPRDITYPHGSGEQDRKVLSSNPASQMSWICRRDMDGWAGLRSSGMVGSSVGGGRDAALAAMAAVGIQLGSVDEGSPARGPRSLVACLPVARDRRWPRPPARWTAREGGGRDADWQGG